jgi:copper homeostasis protein (lipoprotein)
VLACLFVQSPLFAKTVTLAAADNRTSICLIEGDTLVVTLPSPMADSYRWRAKLAKGSPLTAEREDDAPEKGATAPATQTFRFNAASVGEGKLALSFERLKADGAGATQTFSVAVTVASGTPASLRLIGRYAGTTACADCSGIRTVLRLYAKGPNDFTEALYVSARTYLGGRDGDQSFAERGEWAVLRGDASDPDATVYALNPDHPEQAQYLLLQPGGATLTQLDRQMRRIDAPPQYQSILKRVE